MPLYCLWSKLNISLTSSWLCIVCSSAHLITVCWIRFCSVAKKSNESTIMNKSIQQLVHQTILPDYQCVRPGPDSSPVVSAICPSSLAFHTSWSSFSPVEGEGISSTFPFSPSPSSPSGALGMEQWWIKSMWNFQSRACICSWNGEYWMGSSNSSGFLKANKFLIWNSYIQDRYIFASLYKKFPVLSPEFQIT